MPTPIDVPKFNLKSHDLFEIAKAFFVCDEKKKKECEIVISDLAKLLADAKTAHDTAGLSEVDKKELSRVLDKLNIAKNYLQKTLNAFTSVEKDRVDAAESLEKARKKKEALIASRQKDKRKAVAAA